MTASDGRDDGNAWILAVVRQYEGPLTLYAGRLLGDADGARDAVQETLLRLCRQERREVEPRLAAWLFTVCRNLIRDVQRKESRMTHAQGAALAARPDPALGPAESVELAEAKGHVHKSLAQLPANQQEVLRLKFQNGFSYREISDVTGLTVGNVGFLIHTGLKSLRTRLAAVDPALVPPNA